MKERLTTHGIMESLVSVTRDFRRSTSAQLPVLEIETLGGRAEKGTAILTEASNLSGISAEEGALVGTTIAASPHTTVTVSRENFTRRAEEVYGETVSLAENVREVPLHLLVWWFGQPKKRDPSGQPGRCDLIGLSNLTDEKRKPFLNLISQHSAKAVLLLRTLLGMSPGKASESLRIYGLFGFSTKEERKRSGLSRGAQSNGHGHICLTYATREAVRPSVILREVTPREKTKQIGPWDTLLFDEFGISVRKVIMDKIRARVGERLGFRVGLYRDYSRRSDDLTVPSFEGFRIVFDQEIEYTLALNVVLDIVGSFEDFYQNLIEFYKEHHKAWGKKTRMTEVERRLKEFVEAFGFDKEDTQKVIDLVRHVQPTYGQLVKWIDELEKDLGGSHEETLKILRRKRDFYEKMAARLKDGKERERILRILKALYGMDGEAVEAMFPLIEDRLKDPQKEYLDIWFTWSRHFSGSFLFDSFSITRDGKIRVKSLSIAPRIATTKGVAEDLLGVILRRAMGK